MMFRKDWLPLMGGLAKRGVEDDKEGNNSFERVLGVVGGLSEFTGREPPAEDDGPTDVDHGVVRCD